MKKISMVLSLCLIALSSCVNNGFGKYYRIKEVDMEVPFAKPPIKPAVSQYDVADVAIYTHEYPNKEDDDNYLYGVEVSRWKQKGLTMPAMVDLAAEANAKQCLFNLEGYLLSQTKGKFRDKDCITQKFAIKLLGFGDARMTSLFFFHRGHVVKLFVFTGVGKADNPRINEFFESVKL